MNRRTWMVALPFSAVLALTFAAVADAEVAYRIESIELPPGANAQDLNNKGEITATLPSFLGGRQIETPLLLRRGRVIDLTRAIGSPGESIALGQINDRSVMVGSIVGDTTQSFVFRLPHRRTDLPHNQAIVLGINNRNEVFGAWFKDPASSDQPFVWRRGQITLLPSLPGGISGAAAINDRGDVVGISGPDPARAVVWFEDMIMPLPLLPGATFAQGNAINNLRQVVGVNEFRNETGAILKAFLWVEGTLIELPPPPECSSSFPVAINDWGVVAGTAGGCEIPDAVPILWVNTRPVRLEDVIATDDPLKAQLRLRAPITINDRGWILVQATDRATSSDNVYVVLKPTRRVGALHGDAP